MEHKQPEIRAPHQVYLVIEVPRVRHKTSFTFFEWKRFQSRLLPLVCVKWRVFPKQELILSYIVLVILKEWLVLRY